MNYAVNVTTEEKRREKYPLNIERYDMKLVFKEINIDNWLNICKKDNRKWQRIKTSLSTDFDIRH